MPRPDPHHPLTPQEARQQCAPGFAPVDGQLLATFTTRNFAQGLDFVNRIGEVAEKWDHHPDLELRYSQVVVQLMSHDDQALTYRDIRMSRLIAECATDMGLAADPVGSGDQAHPEG